MKLALFMVSLLVASVGFANPEKQGLEIAQKTDKANQGFVGESSIMEMILINASGDKITRKMESKIKEVVTDGDKSIITFKWPADVKGVKMLTWTHKTADDDQWLYMPAFKRVKRISSKSKSGSFMGSEFFYEDLGSQEVEKYTYKFIKDDKAEGRGVWVTERYPVDKKSGYSKQKVWTDKEYMNPVKVEYYDRKGELLKTATFTGYKKMGKFWRNDKIEMINHQTRKSSIISWSQRKLGKKFSDREFHKNRLDR